VSKHYRDSLTVRYRTRVGHERMNPKTPEPFVIEVGYPIKTAPTIVKTAALLRERERGLMVAMLFSHHGDMPGALHGAAELWDGFVERHPSVREGGPELVLWRIPGGGMMDVTMLARDVGPTLHRFADKWEELARRAFDEHQADAIVRRQPFKFPPTTGVH
jgi:hypothetical protein